MLNNQTKNNKCYPIREMKDKGKLIITNEVLNQIVYLHSKFGAIEWSGMLLYDVINEDISNPSNFILKAKHIFLMDIGNAGSTEYNTDSDIVDIYDNIPEAINLKIGHIHSHHSMTCFFSGTDIQELMDNSDKHNYYLSLIVNFSGNYEAKVSFVSNIKSIQSINYRDDSGKIRTFEKIDSGETLIVIDMNVVTEYKNEFFEKRVSQVKDKKNEKEKFNRYDNNINRYIEDDYKPYTQTDFYSQKILLEGKQTNLFENTNVKKFLNPANLNNIQLENLTKNIITSHLELRENRSIYAILLHYSKFNKEELNFYYEYLYTNLEDVLDSYFNADITTFSIYQIKVLIRDVISTIKKNKDFKNLSEVIDGIVNVLENFIEEYEIINDPNLQV